MTTKLAIWRVFLVHLTRVAIRAIFTGHVLARISIFSFVFQVSYLLNVMIEKQFDQ